MLFIFQSCEYAIQLYTAGRHRPHTLQPLLFFSSWQFCISIQNITAGLFIPRILSPNNLHILPSKEENWSSGRVNER